MRSRPNNSTTTILSCMGSSCVNVRNIKTINTSLTLLKFSFTILTVTVDEIKNEIAALPFQDHLINIALDEMIEALTELTFIKRLMDNDINNNEVAYIDQSLIFLQKHLNILLREIKLENDSADIDFSPPQDESAPSIQFKHI